MERRIAHGSEPDEAMVHLKITRTTDGNVGLPQARREGFALIA
jgi:hypothetical protein